MTGKSAPHQSAHSIVDDATDGARRCTDRAVRA